MSSELKREPGALPPPVRPPLGSALEAPVDGWGWGKDKGPREQGVWRKIHELFDEFSLLGELEDEEEEEEEKFIPVSPGGFVAVFCPLRLFRHTGHVSCCSSHGTMQLLWNR